MRHIQPISRAQLDWGTNGNMDLIETAVVMLLTVFFSGWDNYSSVMSNLQKFYRKT